MTQREKNQQTSWNKIQHTHTYIIQNTHHRRRLQFFRQNALALLLDAFGVSGVALQVGQNEQIGMLEAVQIGLLRRKAEFGPAAPPVRATGGDDAAKDQENVPQQKGNEFKAIVAHAAATTASIACCCFGIGVIGSLIAVRVVHEQSWR